MKLFVLASLLWTAVAVTGQQQPAATSLPCQGQCLNGGTCVPGEASFLGHPTSPDGTPLAMHTQTSIKGFHCQCPPGWTGVRCDVTFASCSDTDHKCYNGGSCLQGLADKYGNEQHFCNCDDARDAQGNPVVGKYCEHKPVSTCSSGDEKDAFCVNDGACNPLYPNYGPPCLCSANHQGPHCEYTADNVPKCDLACANGGHCVLGEDTTLQLENEPFVHDTTDFQHCQCPPGYGGPLCRSKKATCGDKHCYHGSSCLVEEGSSANPGGQYCDCSPINSDGVTYSGAYCEFVTTTATIPDMGTVEQLGGENLDPTTTVGVSTETITFDNNADYGDLEFCDHNVCKNGGICRRDTETELEHCLCLEGTKGVFCEERCGQGQPCEEHQTSNICTVGDLGPGKPLSFCMNGGICKATVTVDQPHPGCDCDDDWSGPHCEMRVAKIGADAPQDENDCPEGWIGPGCSIPIAPAGHVSRPQDLETEEDVMASNQSDCPEGFIGPDCTIPLAEAGHVEQHHAGLYGNDKNGDGEYDDDGGYYDYSQQSQFAVETFLLVVILILLAALVLFMVAFFVQRRKHHNEESIKFLRGGDSYSDEPNLSPHRDSVSDPFPSRVHSLSSSDPMASEPTRSASNRFKTPVKDEESDDLNSIA